MIKKVSRFIVLLGLSFSLLIGAGDTLMAKKKLKQIYSTSASLRLQWYQNHLELKNVSKFKNLKWRFIGPEIMSGRIVDVAIPKGSKFTIYAASASGGVWKTINEGTTWEPIFEHAPSTSIGDVTISESDPNIVWIGTGESNIFRSSMSGTGVYKSQDAGKSWTHMGLPETQHIGRIIIHPTNPDIVYVASSGHEYTYNKERGVFKTEDGGKTWEKVFYINEKAGVNDLAMDPSDSKILYATVWDRIRHAWNDPKPGDNDAIYKTVDGGKSWSKIVKGLPPLKLVGRIGLDVSKSNPNVVYALMDNHNPARQAEKGEKDSYGRLKKAVIKGAEVYRSDDKGETWKKVSESSKLIERLFSTYGWVFSQIRVDPNDENTVFIMGVPLLKSVDGGKTFKTSYYPGLHGDHHAMWIDPDDSNHIVNGNDGGINISYDGGKTWKNCENHGIVQFYNVAVDMAEPFNIYGSIQDNGSYRGPVTHRPGIDPRWEWESVPGGEASYLAVDPTHPNILYNESFYGRIRRSESINGEWKTKNIAPKAKKGDPPLRGQWLAPFIISPHNPFILYHGMQYVIRTLDKGETWERISPDLTYNDPKKQGDIPFATITTMSESPLKFGLIYVGTDDGKVHVTRDGGKKWTEIMKGLPYKKWVSRIVASEYDEGIVFLSQNGKRDDDFNKYLFMSTDYGRTWKDISHNIPCGPINVIKEDPKNKNLLYVGTDLGVYISLNRGKEWHSFCNNMPTTFVHDLVVHPRDNILVAGTHGRGVYVIDVSFLQGYDAKIQEKHFHLFEVAKVKLPTSWWAPVKEAEVVYVLKQAQEVIIKILDSKGKVVKQAKVKADTGFNKFTWDLMIETVESRFPLAKKGTYTIQIKAGENVQKQKLELI
jgi:photosystem II stability/assembly factor-like uncharacterized protein